MKTQTFHECMARLAAVFDRGDNQAHALRIGVYEETLRDLSDAEMVRGTRWALRNSVFWPAPAELIEHARGGRGAPPGYQYIPGQPHYAELELATGQTPRLPALGPGSDAH